MRFHWIIRLCTWLDQTAISQFIQSAGWIVPAVQTVHILSIAAVFASATMITCRLIGWTGLDRSPRQFAARFLPFIWWPLLLLLATGTVMIIGEPARELANWVFQLKMLLLIAAIIATRTMQRKLAAATSSSAGTGTPRPLRALSVVSLLLWVGIIFAGRWIAYI
jgi:hypothetical protein